MLTILVNIDPFMYSKKYWLIMTGTRDSEKVSSRFYRQKNIYTTNSSPFLIPFHSFLPHVCHFFLSFVKLQFLINYRNTSGFIVFISCLFSPPCINTCSSSPLFDSSAFLLLHHPHVWQSVNKELLSIFSTSSGLRPKNKPTLYISLFCAVFSIQLFLVSLCYSFNLTSSAFLSPNCVNFSWQLLCLPTAHVLPQWAASFITEFACLCFSTDVWHKACDIWTSLSIIYFNIYNCFNITIIFFFSNSGFIGRFLWNKK